MRGALCREGRLRNRGAPTGAGPLICLYQKRPNYLCQMVKRVHVGAYVQPSMHACTHADVQAIDMSRFKPAPATGREHDVVFPLTDLLRGVVVHVPEHAAAAAAVPSRNSNKGSSGSEAGSPLSTPDSPPRAQTPWTAWLAAQQEQQQQEQLQLQGQLQELPFVQITREEVVECEGEQGGCSKVFVLCHSGTAKSSGWLRLCKKAV